MVIFHSYVSHYQRVWVISVPCYGLPVPLPGTWLSSLECGEVPQRSGRSWTMRNVPWRQGHWDGTLGLSMTTWLSGWWFETFFIGKSSPNGLEIMGNLWEIYDILVGGDWNMTGIMFPFSWEFHHRNWLSYFSEGLKPPTSMCLLGKAMIGADVIRF